MYVLGGQGLHRVAFPQEDKTPAICRHLCHGTAGAPGLPKASTGCLSPDCLQTAELEAKSSFSHYQPLE